MTAEFSTRIRVYIEDTDAGGIVYYVNYLKFFERARTEFMRSCGYDKPAFVGSDAMFVVSDVNVKYLLPARLDDELDVSAVVEAVGAATIRFRQRVMRANALLADGLVTIALVRASDGRPRRLDKAMREAVAG